MIVVFNINKTGLAGLGATVRSLMTYSSKPETLELCFLTSDGTEIINEHLIDLCQANGVSRPIRIIPYNAEKEFGHFKPFHGDYTVYGKSLIPSYFPNDKVLYLDTDLLVSTDVCQLEDFDTKGHPISAVTNAPVSLAYDRDFLTGTLDFPQDTHYFNAGVILFDCTAYNSSKYSERWNTIGLQHSQSLRSADQTLFNAICKGKFGHLPTKYNVGWSPNQYLSPDWVGDSIIHFIGSPKPWDMFGRIVHSGYGVWRSHTSEEWFDSFCRPTRYNLKRAWNIRRSILRHLFNFRNSNVSPPMQINAGRSKPCE